MCIRGSGRSVQIKKNVVGVESGLSECPSSMISHDVPLTLDRDPGTPEEVMILTNVPVKNQKPDRSGRTLN